MIMIDGWSPLRGLRCSAILFWSIMNLTRRVISTAYSIAASALLSWGIATGTRYVAGTRYADAYLDNVNRAFVAQYDDIRIRSDAALYRAQSDADKN